MLDLVPFAGAPRKMTNGKAQPPLIREFLQFQFPQPQPPSVASTTVGPDQNRLRPGIEAFAFNAAPPPPDEGPGKGAGVIVGSHIDKTGIVSDVVNAIRIASVLQARAHNERSVWSPSIKLETWSRPAAADPVSAACRDYPQPIPPQTI